MTDSMEMGMMSAATARTQADEVIRPGIHVNVAHARISHGAARIVRREPADNLGFATGRRIEIDRPPVPVHRGMAGTRNHGTGPAGRDDLHWAKSGFDPLEQLPCFRGQA